jgi:hypothetical protein
MSLRESFAVIYLRNQMSFGGNRTMTVMKTSLFQAILEQIIIKEWQLTAMESHIKIIFKEKKERSLQCQKIYSSKYNLKRRR